MSSSRLTCELRYLVNCGIEVLELKVWGAAAQGRAITHSRLRGANGEEQAHILNLVERKYPSLHLQVQQMISDGNFWEEL